MSQCIYQTVIVDKGVNVDAFGGEMMILFGSGAPDTLKDFCYSIEVHEPEATIEAGQDLIIDGEAFRIQSVGEIAVRGGNRPAQPKGAGAPHRQFYRNPG